MLSHTTLATFFQRPTSVIPKHYLLPGVSEWSIGYLLFRPSGRLIRSAVETCYWLLSLSCRFSCCWLDLLCTSIPPSSSPWNALSKHLVYIVGYPTRKLKWASSPLVSICSRWPIAQAKVLFRLLWVKCQSSTHQLLMNTLSTPPRRSPCMFVTSEWVLQQQSYGFCQCLYQYRFISKFLYPNISFTATSSSP